jgi:hypothetical protein
MWLPVSPLKVEERVEFSKDLTSWKIILEAMAGSAVVSGVVDLMYVVLW